MKYILSTLAFSLFAFTAHAAPELNDDKQDGFILKRNGVDVGQVTISSVFSEEQSLASPVEITVTTECKPGFRASGTKNLESWEAFDFGNSRKNDQLSSYNEKNQELTVYYWNSKPDGRMGRTHNQSLARKISLRDVCVAKKK